MGKTRGSPGFPCTTFKGDAPPLLEANGVKGDMANLLNFDSNREIGFSYHRTLNFELARDLNFDLNRELYFHPNRDLGFGKRGVLFRGYERPNCRAIVSADATPCDECGAVFHPATLMCVQTRAPTVSILDAKD